MSLLWVDYPIVVCAWAFGEAFYLSRCRFGWMCVGWDGMKHPWFFWVIFYLGHLYDLLQRKNNLYLILSRDKHSLLLRKIKCKNENTRFCYMWVVVSCGWFQLFGISPKITNKTMLSVVGSGGISPCPALRWPVSQGDVLAALAMDPSIKCPIAIGNWSNTVEGESCFVGCLQCPLVILERVDIFRLVVV